MRPRVMRRGVLLAVHIVKDSVPACIMYHVSGKKQDLNPSPVISKSETIFTCKLFCSRCSFHHRVATKERHKSQLLLHSYRNKACECCFLCRSLEFCKYCHKCPNCCHKSTCMGKATAVLGEVGGSGFESKGGHNTE